MRPRFLAKPAVADVPALEHLSLLNEASVRIGTTLDLGETAAELVDVLVPALADAAGILVLERLVTADEFPGRAAGGVPRVRRMAVAVADDNAGEWRRAFPIDEVTLYPDWTPYARCMAEGGPVVFAELESELAAEIGLRMWRRDSVYNVLVSTSFLVVPLKARGEVLGFVVLTRRPERPCFDERDIALAEELAARAGVCVDNARLYSRERRTALTLQRGLLPTRLPVPLGLEIAHRYLPASDLTGVGGDWYDVITLPGGRTALVVGDVMGHGTEAATTMGQLRTAVRTLAGLDLTPAQVLRQLDLMTLDLDSMQTATCIYAVYDAVSTDWVIGRAGHVPPILLYADGSTEILDLAPGLPLGIGGEPFDYCELRLPAGATLIICTDGLIESRDRDIDTGLDELRKALTGRPLPLDDLAETAVQSLRRPDHDPDDIALLMARVRPLGPEEIAGRRFPPEPESVRAIRSFAAEVLRRWDLEALSDTVRQLISELATNALRHGRGPIEVQLIRGTRLTCEVADGSDLLPKQRSPTIEDESGRGIQLISLLAARWGCRPLATGKSVWFELDLERPAG